MIGGGCWFLPMLVWVAIYGIIYISSQQDVDTELAITSKKKERNIMTAQPDNKILERIRALLAMGGDVSSEHEAAIALKRARALMDKHQVTLSDIENISDDSFGSSYFETDASKQKKWVTSLAINVAKLNDCIASINSRSNRRAPVTYVFKGFAEDAKICDFMLIYLVDTCNRLYNRDKAKLGLSGMSDKNDYLHGLVSGLSIKMEEMIRERREERASDGRSLVLVKKAMVEQEFGEAKYKTGRARSVDADVYNAGKAAAKDVHLGSFVGNSTAAKAAIA